MKFTRKVRRGLCLVRRLMLDVCDDSKPPAATIVAKWPRRWQDDYNAAVDWMASVEVEPEEPRRPIRVRGAGAALAQAQRGSARIIAVQADGEACTQAALAGLRAFHDAATAHGVTLSRDVPEQLLLEGTQ